MKQQLFSAILMLGIGLTASAQQATRPGVAAPSAPSATSPGGRVSLSVTAPGRAVVSCRQQRVLEVELPVAATALEGVTPQRVKTDYRLVSGKRRHCTNEANEYRLDSGLVVRLYDDGVALRYEGSPQWLSGTDATVYRIPEGTRRWMQQWTDSYEGFYPLSTTFKVRPVPSYSGQSASAEGWNDRWAYPVLMEPADGVFALITEANIGRGQSASCLRNEGERFRVVPDRRSSAPPVVSPWRVVIVGTLAEVVESTLVTDVSDPCRLDDAGWVRPGVASWVYWAYNHGSSDYDIVRKYTDLAATLKLPYVLIDAEWDAMGGGKTVEDAVSYALAKGVRPMIWYNSSVGWVDGAPTPKFRLNKPEDREREFAWCEKIGVAGVKVDFFSGDTQLNMDFCQDLMESAARHHLLVNFHGATLPRGWQRTWPNLLTTEAVYGAEWYNNVPTFTAKAAAHNATLPFTRNVVGPMDYTPCAFSDSQHPHITTHAHELALTVLFESGLQHLADRPESLLSQPLEVQQFFGSLPAAWDDTRLLDGYPGDRCMLARRCGTTWYVAAVNGTDRAKDFDLAAALQRLGARGRATLFADGDGQPWRISRADGPEALPATVTAKPRGGFVLVIGG